MALVKNQIWSPDQINESGGFQLFGSTEDTGISQKSDSGFQVPQEYLRDLMADPHVQRYVEAVIEGRTKKALLQILCKYDWTNDDRIKSGDLEKLSLEELQSHLQRLENQLAARWKNSLEQLEQKQQANEKLWEKTLEDWKRQKETLLRNHEREWCETLSYLVQKIQIRSSSRTFEDVEKWMRQNVTEFMEQERVTVFLSPQDYEVLKREAHPVSKDGKWVLMEDSGLKAGQIRFEAGNAGVIFDEKKNIEKVLGWIEST